MAQATHLTISTADRIRLDAWQDQVRGYDEQNHDDEDEERNEVRQEVQVSVTYVLNHGDTDLVKLAAEKAVEVKRAHEAVWHRIGAFQSPASHSCDGPPGCQGGSGCKCSSDGSGRPRPERLNGSGLRSDDDRQNGDSQQKEAAASITGAFGANGVSPDSRVNHAAGKSRAGSSGSRNGNTAASPVPDLSPPPEPASKPQKILIRSRAQKVGLSSAGLQEVIWKQYRHYSLERLTKAQANAILLALDRYEQTGRIEMIETPPNAAVPASEPPRDKNFTGAASHEVPEMPHYAVVEEDDWEPQDTDVPACF